jgi:hypothetical protein
MTQMATRTTSISGRQAIQATWPAWFTQAAFLLAVSLVLARAMMLEQVRDAFAVVPGSQPYPRAPGPATGLILDLLCAVPALLILARRLVDSTYIIRWGWTHVLTGLLGAWVALSTIWADDKFAAMVSSAHLVAAFCLIWAMSQLVRSWLRLRLVAAVCFGLLLANLTNALLYRFVELPDLQKSYSENRETFLRERGWTPDSFNARQFELKITSGELIGFNSSANSFGAVVVFLLVATTGLTIQRAADDRPGGWLAVPIAVAAVAIWMLAYTHSKAAMAAPVLAGALLLLTWKLRRRGADRHRLSFAVGAALVLMFAGIVVAYGLKTGRLPTDSLKFRWRYWIATVHMIAARPWLGVGWSNFGLHYLRYRLPDASEEIKDPHNFPLRFASETGLIGLVVALAWLGRLWWELTLPVLPAATAEPVHPVGRAAGSKDKAACGVIHLPEDGPMLLSRYRAIPIILSITLLSVAINFVSAVDLSSGFYFVIGELLKKVFFAAAIFVGSLLAALTLRQKDHIDLDDRPAPWVLYGMLVALAVFLVQNLIEFSLFETGPLMLFAMMTGAALGVRQPSSAGHKRRTALATGWTVIGGLGWIVAAAMLVVPTVTAESEAQDADDALRANRLNEAAAGYLSAFEHQRLNADYANRSGIALAYAAADPRQALATPRPADWIRSRLMAAVEHNPSEVSYYLNLASYFRSRRQAAEMQSAFNTALRLNPNEVSIHLQYADALQDLGLVDEAAAQYESALHYNALLPEEEPKRLPTADIRLPYARLLKDHGRIGDAAAQLRASLSEDAALTLESPSRLPAARIDQIRQMLRDMEQGK